MHIVSYSLVTGIIASRVQAQYLFLKMIVTSSRILFVWQEILEIFLDVVCLFSPHSNFFSKTGICHLPFQGWVQNLLHSQRSKVILYHKNCFIIIIYFYTVVQNIFANFFFATAATSVKFSSLLCLALLLWRSSSEGYGKCALQTWQWVSFHFSMFPITNQLLSCYASRLTPLDLIVCRHFLLCFLCTRHVKLL